MDPLPAGAKRFGPTQVDDLYAHLQQYHGIPAEVARTRIHQIKAHYGYGGADNVVFDYTGNVYDPITFEWLGSLTEGGPNG